MFIKFISSDQNQNIQELRPIFSGTGKEGIW